MGVTYPRPFLLDTAQYSFYASMHIREVLLSVIAVSLSHVMFWQSGKLDLLTCLMKMMANCEEFPELGAEPSTPEKEKTRLLSQMCIRDRP